MNMEFWSKAFRFTAVFLVLFVAVEVLTCDLLPSSSCYAEQSQQQDKGQPSTVDNCVCCCAHVMVMQQLIFTPEEMEASALPEESVQQPVSIPIHIDRPPQLS